MRGEHAEGFFIHRLDVLHMDWFRKTRKSGDSVDDIEEGANPFMFGFSSRRLENEHMFLDIHL